MIAVPNTHCRNQYRTRRRTRHALRQYRASHSNVSVVCTGHRIGAQKLRQNRIPKKYHARHQYRAQMRCAIAVPSMSQHPPLYAISVPDIA
eukprot:2024934-Rhodomonas_salina.4